MKTYSIEHILRKKLAYVPGSVSSIGRLLMVISLDLPVSSSLENINHHNTYENNAEVDDLAITLNFYAQLFRFNEILEFNVLAVVDNRSGNWKRLRSVLKMLKMFLPQVAVALVVKADHASTPLNVKLWLNRTRQPSLRRGPLNGLCGVNNDSQSVTEAGGPGAANDDDNNNNNNTTPPGTLTIRPSTVLVIGQSKLSTYIATDQMPTEFGGRYDAYNHATWLVARIAAERYVDRIELLIAQRFVVGDENHHQQQQQSSKNNNNKPSIIAGDWRVRHLVSENNETIDFNQLIELGRKIVTNLSRHSTSKLNADLTASVQMAITSLEPMTFLQNYSKVCKSNSDKTPGNNQNNNQPKVKIYGNNFNNEDDFFMSPLNRDEIEREIQTIRRWLANDGDRLIMCETDVGTSLRSAERLVDKHEIIELGCAETFARYARLISALDMLSLAPYFDADLQLQRQELESTLRTFAMRIDRRRTLLLTSARFFRLLKKTRQAITIISQILSTINEDDGIGVVLSDDQQVMLETNRNRAEILGAKTFEEGARLVQMLTDGTGRADVVREYTKEIEIVVNSSESLRSDLEAMEQVFASPVPIDEEPPPPTSNTSLVSSGHQSAHDLFEKETAVDDDNEQNLEELIAVFVGSLELQLVAIDHFVKSFSDEISSGTVIDSRVLLNKYQSTYFDLERQWSLMNRCGLDFVAKIIKVNSNVQPSTLSAIENAMLTLNRQFSRVRTLWKDIQINKVQSDIVKLLEVCSRRGGSNAPSCNSVNTSSPNEAVQISREDNNSDDTNVSSFSNKIYYQTRFPPVDTSSPTINTSRQSSGLPSSLSSSPGQNKAATTTTRVGNNLEEDTLETLEQYREVIITDDDVITAAAAPSSPTKSPSLAIRRCFTSTDLTRRTAREDIANINNNNTENNNNNNSDYLTSPSSSYYNAKWLSDPELHFY